MQPPKRIHLDDSLYRIPGHVHFITIQAQFNRPYFMHHNLNTRVIACLRDQKELSRCHVYVYCLMPTHLHFLAAVTSDDTSVLDLVSQFKGRSTRIGWKCGIRGALWQRRNYDHIVRKTEDLRDIAMYILNNPVRKLLVEDYRDYPYCGQCDTLPG